MVLAEGQTLDQWNRAENREIDLDKYFHLIFDKAAKVMQ